MVNMNIFFWYWPAYAILSLAEIFGFNKIFCDKISQKFDHPEDMEFSI